MFISKENPASKNLNTHNAQHYFTRLFLVFSAFIISILKLKLYLINWNDSIMIWLEAGLTKPFGGVAPGCSVIRFTVSTLSPDMVSAPMSLAKHASASVALP
jgi:uncharacterized membrane-anchored protein